MFFCIFVTAFSKAQNIDALLFFSMVNRSQIVNNCIVMMKKILATFLLGCVVLPTCSQTVSPLVSAEYDQTAPFNESCPGNSASGCGPTAIAQILTRYKSPAGPTGSASYKYDGKTVDVNLDGMSFDWSNILDKYVPGSYNNEQAKAVADLVFACGAAMNVTYGNSTPVTNYARMLYGLQHNLHFSVNARYLRRAFYSTAEWIEMLNEQLEEGHPVFYRGTWFFNGDHSDHMFLIDGLDEEGYYHVNFGKRGSGNKYADINYLNQSGTYPGNRGVCWNASQVMLINGYPTPDFNDYPKQVCISEEPIILNKDTMLHTATFDLGSAFTLSCRLRNCSNDKASVNFGWALVKDGKFIKMLTTSSYGLSPGNTFKNTAHLTVRLPMDLEDGEYSLQLFHKQKDETDWREVWQCAPTVVHVAVNGKKATVTPPDNHLGNPNLYMTGQITEVENNSGVPGRVFQLQLANNTTNNFEGLFMLEIAAEGESYEYEITQSIYSQTQPVFHVLVPTSAYNLEGKAIDSVKTYYNYAEKWHLIGVGESSSVVIDENKHIRSNGYVEIYSVNGLLVSRIPAAAVSSSYERILNDLPQGVYIIKDGKIIRKIVRK